MIALVCGLVILGVIELFHLAVTASLVRRLREQGPASPAPAEQIGGPEVGERTPAARTVPGVPEDTEVLFGFFSVGCPSCRTEAPRFANAVPALGDAGVHPIAVLAGPGGTERDEYAALLDRVGTPVLDDAARAAFRSFAVRGTPAFFLVRGDGTVLGKGASAAAALIASNANREPAAAGA
ncbi:redoxin domain-containing protein [Actinospica durhamensis]|uniref:Redoxin domain-containing protein n=1 Tax=Actinospica durhamensis TaxID=1508375 RepID=A0A941INB6_9ACTN|nr:redoxin domain-containing protein [Actinospica durhamensis]MBR7831837.1 redoxin domain-containing protein [Actinospica durhamensis]